MSFSHEPRPSEQPPRPSGKPLGILLIAAGILAMGYGTLAFFAEGFVTSPEYGRQIWVPMGLGAVLIVVGIVSLILKRR